MRVFLAGALYFEACIAQLGWIFRQLGWIFSGLVMPVGVAWTCAVEAWCG